MLAHDCMASDGGNKLKWIGLSMLVVLGGALLMLLTSAPAAGPVRAPTPERPDYEPQPPSAEPQEGPEVKVQPEAPTDDEEGPDQESGEVDLFAGATNDLLTDAHRRLLEGKRLGARMTKQLYDYGQEHPGDPLPQLLMAHDGMKQQRYGIAVRLYRMAWQADEAAKQDPKMLGDLVSVAATHNKVEHREAVEVIKMIYGTEALGEIDRSLASARATVRPKVIMRLEALRGAVIR